MREEAEEEASDEPADDLGRAIADTKRNCTSDLERMKLQRMLEDHKKLLYPNCEADKKKLGTTLELLQWKAENGVSDNGFGKLLVMIKNMLSKENELPESTHEENKVVCPLGLEVQKIHACPNDCILYRGEYEDLNAFPVCGALRYKISRDDPGDVKGEHPRKKIHAKVMWYAPIIPHHLGRNLLPRALALDITKVIAADLITQCTTYRASVQILVRIVVEDVVIRACMYLLHL